MSKEILKCSYCDELIDECDNCGKKFKVGQEIFCFPYEGGSHFCSGKCADTFLNGWTHEVVQAEVLSADE